MAVILQFSLYFFSAFRFLRFSFFFFFFFWQPHLGEFPERLFTDKAAEEAISRFKEKLDKFFQGSKRAK